MSVKPAVFMRAASAGAVWRERFVPATANLQFLSCSECEIQPGARTQAVSYPAEEALLFTWRGNGCAALGDRTYSLATYDVLYIPKGQPFTISNPGGETLQLFVTRAPASNVHPP